MKKIEYKVTKRLSPEVIREILEVEKNDGLTAETLLDKAERKKSSLHDLFEWDNSKAGEQWRLQQARVIINEIKIIVEDKELYAFENVRINVSEEEGLERREYKPIIEILSKEEYRKQVLRTALENINYWKEKYSEYTELQLIFDSISKVRAKWQKEK